MPSYSIIPVLCNGIRLRSGWLVDPLVIGDVRYFTTEARLNQQHPFNTTVLTIEDAESPTEIPAETQEETLIETNPTQPTREPPYHERLILQKTLEKP